MKTLNLEDFRWDSVVVNIDCQPDRVDIYVGDSPLNMPVRYLIVLRRTTLTMGTSIPWTGLLD